MNTLTAIVTAVLNSLWQAALLAALVWLALRLARRVNATTRFAIWWATLGMVVILPAAPGTIAWVQWAFRSPPVLPLKHVHSSPPTPAQGTALPPLVIVEGRRMAQWRLWIAAIWALTLFYRLIQVARSYFYLRGVKRRALVSSPLLPRGRRVARLLLSAEIGSPIAAGFARPAVILPDSLPRRLSPQDLDYVLQHETAHLERWDDWTNLIARVLDAALALHPVALWILRRIEIEREAACDDWVIARSKAVPAQAAFTYAQSLLRLYELKFGESPTNGLLAAGIFGNGSRLSVRIEALLRRGREFTPRTSMQSVALSAIALLMIGGFASLAPRWVAFAQEATGPEFEVASIHASNPDQGFINAVTPSLNIPGDRNLTFVQVSLRDLIMLAYGVGAPQIQGPRFLEGTPNAPTDRFDIVARVPAGAAREQIPLMLRALLTERFHLKVHQENKTIQVYALEIGNGAPKMKESPSAAIGPARCVRSFAEREGATLAAECTHMTSADIAQQVMALAPGYFRDAPVVDVTGLTGVYDFKLEWITAVEARNGNPGPSMIDAIQNQLGLKMERKREAVETLVIDKIDRKPTEN
jgi:uncharacterized protein (TIGR03435 family)